MARKKVKVSVDKVQFVCNCSNCGLQLIDMNPKIGAKSVLLKGNEVSMVKGEDGNWVCPLCGTNDYIVEK